MKALENDLAKLINETFNTYKCSLKQLEAPFLFHRRTGIPIFRLTANQIPFESLLEFVAPRTDSPYLAHDTYGCYYEGPYSLAQFIATDFDLIDAREDKKDQEKRIHPKDEKRYSMFASFFVKLKQLRMDILQAIQHAKCHILTKDKIDLLILLRNLCTSKNYGHHGKAITEQAKNSGLSCYFHFDRGNGIGESKDSRRTTLCREKKRSYKLSVNADLRVNALRPAY